MPAIPTAGLPLADRAILAVMNWAAGHLSPMGVIRLAHGLPRRRAR